MASNDNNSNNGMRIEIIEDGPYIVHGNVPLVRKTQVVSEHGEPLVWKRDGAIQTDGGEYDLCRCGQSGNKPFCDGTHVEVGFDGSERATSSATESLQMTFQGGTRLIVKKDLTLCMNSGFCGMAKTSLAQLIIGSKDTQSRSLAMAMVERCPSGALTYHVEPGEPDIEPDLPLQIAVTTEITVDGPIAGPLWVSGGIPIERSDGQPFETRDRVTLCNCGNSNNKPMCDGAHRYEAQLLAKQHKIAGKKAGKMTKPRVSMK
jgi:CDGSH-type Zn-finger protein